MYDLPDFGCWGLNVARDLKDGQDLVNQSINS
jgi:hypothetical protein